MEEALYYTVSVGITGHRKLSLENLPRIKEQITFVLQSIHNETERTADSFRFKPLLRIVSCLSEGSDRLAADKALSMGWQLLAILPFPLQSQVHGMDLNEAARIQSKKDLTDLCSTAQAVIQLCQNPPKSWQHAVPPFNDPTSDNALAASFRQQCYKEASDIVIEQSDIILAIWNGLPQSESGGTFDTIGSALKRRIPVILIDSTHDSPARIITAPEQLWSTDTSSNQEAFQEAYQKVFQEALRAVFASHLSPDSKTIEKIRNEITDAETTANLKIPKTAKTWSLFQRLICKNKLTTLPASNAEPLKDHLFTIFDSSANYYAALQRSAIIKVACLTTLAVTCSTLAILLPTDLHANLPLSLIEIVSLLYAVFSVRGVRRKKWQQKFTRRRFIAEVARVNAYTRKFATECMYANQDSFYEGASDDSIWIKHILRVMIRYRGLSSVNFSDAQTLREMKDELCRNLIHDQVAYHTMNSRRSGLTEKFIEKVCETLFWIALVASVINLSDGIILPSDLLSFLSTVVPLAAISAQSISHNTELKRLALRSEHLRIALAQIECELQNTSDPETIRSVVSSLSKLMLADTMEWKDQYNIENVNV